MDGIDVVYYPPYSNAICASVIAAPGTHTFSGTSWFAIRGYSI